MIILKRAADDDDDNEMECLSWKLSFLSDQSSFGMNALGCFTLVRTVRFLIFHCCLQNENLKIWKENIFLSCL